MRVEILRVAGECSIGYPALCDYLHRAGGRQDIRGIEVITTAAGRAVVFLDDRHGIVVTVGGASALSDHWYVDLWFWGDGWDGAREATLLVRALAADQAIHRAVGATLLTCAAH